MPSNNMTNSLRGESNQNSSSQRRNNHREFRSKFEDNSAPTEAPLPVMQPQEQSISSSSSTPGTAVNIPGPRARIIHWENNHGDSSSDDDDIEEAYVAQAELVAPIETRLEQQESRMYDMMQASRLEHKEERQRTERKVTRVILCAIGGFAIALIVVVAAVVVFLRKEKVSDINVKDGETDPPSVSISIAPTPAETTGADKPYKMIDFEDRAELLVAVDEYLESPNQGFDRLNMSRWNVGKVTDFESLFQGIRHPAAAFFNDPAVGEWDMSSATTLKYMFDGYDPSQKYTDGHHFNQPLHKWNTSKVEILTGIFSSNPRFNQNVNSWDVGKVADFSCAFCGASEFNQPLSNWKVSQANVMHLMFLNAFRFNQSIGNWDVSRTTNFARMFEQANSFNQDLTSWDVASGSSFEYMLYGARSFAQDLCSWEISGSILMENMWSDSGCPEQTMYPPGPSNVSFPQAAQCFPCGTVGDD